jgi:hypothetical protein
LIPLPLSGDVSAVWISPNGDEFVVCVPDRSGDFSAEASETTVQRWNFRERTLQGKTKLGPIHGEFAITKTGAPIAWGGEQSIYRLRLSDWNQPLPINLPNDPDKRTLSLDPLALSRTARDFWDSTKHGRSSKFMI